MKRVPPIIRILQGAAALATDACCTVAFVRGNCMGGTQHVPGVDENVEI
jgi:hypothetical protein